MSTRFPKSCFSIALTPCRRWRLVSTSRKMASGSGSGGTACMSGRAGAVLSRRHNLFQPRTACSLTMPLGQPGRRASLPQASGTRSVLSEINTANCRKALHEMPRRGFALRQHAGMIYRSAHEQILHKNLGAMPGQHEGASARPDRRRMLASNSNRPDTYCVMNANNLSGECDGRTQTL